MNISRQLMSCGDVLCACASQVHGSLEVVTGQLIGKLCGTGSVGRHLTRGGTIVFAEVTARKGDCSCRVLIHIQHQSARLPKTRKC